MGSVIPRPRPKKRESVDTLSAAMTSQQKNLYGSFIMAPTIDKMKSHNDDYFLYTDERII